MIKPNALRTGAIENEQIEGLLAMRESLDALKKRYELIENSIKTSEAEIISKLEYGVHINSDYQLLIKTSERRHPSWKAHFISLAGEQAAERVLKETSPTIYKTLLIKGE